MNNSKIIIFSLLFLTIFSNGLKSQEENVWNRIQPTPQEHSLFCIRQIPGTETLVTVGSGSTIMYSDDAGETWDITLNPAGLPNNTWFISVNFYDDQNGYAVANYGRIIRTTDGGQNWDLVYDNFQDSLKTGRADIFVFDPQTAIVVGFNRLILKTDDGGQNWYTYICPDGFYPNSIDFINQDTGYVVGNTDSAIILKTVDGGDNWSTQLFPKEANTNLYDIFFINDSTGIISALKKGITTVVYKSSDAGKSWSIKHKENGTYKAGEIDFKDDLHGAVRIFSWSSSFLYTQDGGETWEPDWDDFFYNYTPCYSFCYGPGYMIGVGAYGNIGRKISDDAEWEKLASNIYYGKCRNAEFISPQTGYVLFTGGGGGGVPSSYLLRTINGGSSWNYVTHGTEAESNFKFLNENYGFWARNQFEGLKLFRTTNGGSSWVYLYNFGDADLYYDQPISLTFLDSLHGIIAWMEKSYITEDAGISWQSLLTLQIDRDEIRSVDYVSEDTIFMSCHTYFFPVVFRSFDGGVTFSSDTIPLDYYYAKKVHFIDHYTGFLLVNRYEYDTGSIYKTTDAGETWYPTVINDTNYSSYNDVFFPTPDTGYVVGSGNYTTMLKTIDGGETWDPVDIPCTSALSNVWFLDEWHGFVFGNSGVIMETLTGGVVGNKENPFSGNEQIFTVAPNPFSGQIQIELNQPGSEKINIGIFTLNGKQVYHDNISENITIRKITVNLTSLSPGIYFCRIVQGNTASTRKIVKM